MRKFLIGLSEVRTSTEIVGAFLQTGDSRVKSSIASVFSIKNAVLKSRGILRKAQVRI